ncbi:unnamed protein product [Protopolystoma xenopodis]|uniref:Uncharacterized protein n=1 Tax=Protopolystoma xenopodis TaxID=117903 RepID=A0A3S5CK18_9PLAT|nr:unnamed protein product [Protopolystoma xenopodis]
MRQKREHPRGTLRKSLASAPSLWSGWLRRQPTSGWFSTSLPAGLEAHDRPGRAAKAPACWFIGSIRCSGSLRDAVDRDRPRPPAGSTRDIACACVCVCVCACGGEERSGVARLRRGVEWRDWPPRLTRGRSGWTGNRRLPVGQPDRGHVEWADVEGAASRKRPIKSRRHSSPPRHSVCAETTAPARPSTRACPPVSAGPRDGTRCCRVLTNHKRGTDCSADLVTWALPSTHLQRARLTRLVCRLGCATSTRQRRLAGVTAASALLFVLRRSVGPPGYRGSSLDAASPLDRSARRFA